jgi:hypothetical protein
MKDQIDCRTMSGESLRFLLDGSGPAVSRRSGNFLYVRGEDADLEVLYVGETDDLAEHARDRWAEAKQNFGARALYVRLNITAAERRREQAELIGAYQPPMNRNELQPSAVRES